ncbi:MAG: Ig-like domain-containing protein [Planctomycetia bacterium]|nr:Ig-like domain-containing protein [Planctomycetia bacterium]
MLRSRLPLVVLAVLVVLVSGLLLPADVTPPNAGRGAGTVPVWNPHRAAPDNPPLQVRVLVLNYDPLVPAEGNRRLSEVFKWNNPAKLAAEYQEAMEYASGGYLRFEIVEWRNLNEIYAQEDGHRYTVEEYVRNRRQNKGWRERGMADYPRLLREQHVAPLVDDGRVDEVWVFSDHFFGLYEASMAGPGAFFINGGVYPQVPTLRPFAFYGFNYERGVAEMMHDASHRTEATMNRAYGPWNLKAPQNHWEKFSANDKQSGGVAGVGTCHWPANAEGDYDYGNKRVVTSWADGFLAYPKLDLTRKKVSRDTWSKGPDYHLDYMKWYFAHLPRAAGVNEDGRQNNWFKYVFDFQSYDAQGRPLPASAELCSGDVADPKAVEHVLRVAYRSPTQIDTASLGDADLEVTGPDGKPLAVKLVGGHEPGGRSYRVARYQVTAPGGTWDKEPAAVYAVALRADRVRTGNGAALPAARLGSFRLSRAGREPEPLAADADTTFLAHFEGNAEDRAKQAPDLAKGLAYNPGVVGQGVTVGGGAELRYAREGILDPKAGTVEFWLRPSWDGKAGKPHVLFQAGAPFDNGLLVQIDGANNLRLMVWGDDPATPGVEANVERGVGVSAAGWKAGDWRHIAVTWKESGRQLALYVDGRLAESTDKGIVMPAFSGKHFWVGSAAGGGNPAEAVFDELRVSHRGRTEAEVRISAAAAGGGAETLALDAPAQALVVGDRAVARATARSKAGLAQDQTRAVAWTSSDPAVLTVDADGTLRARRAGRVTVTARLGALSATANVAVTDPGLPRARLVKAPDVSRRGPGDVSLVVTFDAPAGLRPNTIALGSVRVVGPNGFSQFPELVGQPVGAGRTVTASYRVKPITGTWGEADRGLYSVELKAYQVADAKGQYAPETVLGGFHVLRQAAPK